MASRSGNPTTWRTASASGLGWTRASKALNIEEMIEYCESTKVPSQSKTANRGEWNSGMVRGFPMAARE